jgi:hypothetical protein
MLTVSEAEVVGDNQRINPMALPPSFKLTTRLKRARCSAVVSVDDDGDGEAVGDDNTMTRERVGSVYDVDSEA